MTGSRSFPFPDRSPVDPQLRPLPRIFGRGAVPDRPSEISSGDGALCETDGRTTGILIGYARVSTDAQDLTAQRDALSAL